MMLIIVGQQASCLVYKLERALAIMTFITTATQFLLLLAID
jgi:hypothetical protein